MGYGIGMFLAGLISGAGIGWYSALMKERTTYGDPKKLLEKVAYYQGLCTKLACLWMVTRIDNPALRY